MKQILTPLLVCLTIGLSGVASADPALKRSAESYGWGFFEEKDEMTDEITHLAVKRSNTTIDFMNQRTRQALMIVKPKKSRTNEVMIYLGGNSIYVEPTFEATKYLVRIDDNKALKLNGERAWRGEALLFEYNKELMKQLRSGSKLKARVPTLGKGTHIIEFDLNGAQSAIDYINGK